MILGFWSAGQVPTTGGAKMPKNVLEKIPN